jgi:hypothetical protein
MDSILNFISLTDKIEANGEGVYGMSGPFFKYLNSRGKYSYTTNCKIKDGYKNIIMIEPLGTVYGVSNIPMEDVKKIKKLISQNAKLLIVSLADPSNDYSFEICFNFLKENGIVFDSEITNKENVIFIDSNMRYDTLHTFDYFLEEAMYAKKAFYNTENSLGYVSTPINLTELNTFRNKKFISFNRNNDKLHRLYLLKEYLSGNYKDSYFSFLLNITAYNDDDSELNVTEYNKHLPIELDTHYIKDKSNFSSSDTFKKELFLDSCINIVTETSFINNELFISEKILKPILSYQPFIVFGPYGYLKQLKKYGFKTFSEYWDEGYDDIECPYNRIEVLISLIKKLNNLSIEEMNELYQKTKDICIYNRKLFYTLKIDTLKEILNNIENEW